jgi:hypothetical protein
MKTMSDWLSRAARGIDDPSGVESPPVFTRHDFVTTSCRAAISFIVRECRSAGD